MSAGKGKPVPFTRTRKELTVPLYEEEGTVLRMKMAVATFGEEGEEPAAEILMSMAGDVVELRYGEKQAMFALRDLLKAWVTEVDGEEAGAKFEAADPPMNEKEVEENA